MQFLLHVHQHTEGGIVGFLDSVLLHGLLDSLKIIPFLFITYLIMETIEHSASGKINSFICRAGAFGPAVGGLVGAVPQCGFSAMAANLYCTNVIGAGTLIAVFLSTSDEMLPILISGSLQGGTIIGILAYKTACGILAGFVVSLALKLMGRRREAINIDELCENDGCNCEGGILRSALHHTVSIGLFVIIITLVINALLFFLGEDTLGSILYARPVLSHLIASVVGLIPNCAASVALTTLYTEGIITAGTMLSGLFSGAGVGTLLLFRVNKDHKANLAILGALIFFGIIFGISADLLGLFAIK